MAGLTKYAIVEFQDKRSCVYVTHVDNIMDFYPKHAKDFVKDRIYSTKWEGSFHGDDERASFDGLCSAKILLLGGMGLSQ